MSLASAFIVMMMFMAAASAFIMMMMFMAAAATLVVMMMMFVASATAFIVMMMMFMAPAFIVIFFVELVALICQISQFVKGEVVEIFLWLSVSDELGNPVEIAAMTQILVFPLGWVNIDF